MQRAVRGARDERVGFWAGAAAPFDGLRFVATTPSVWPLALVPVAIAGVLVALLGFGAVVFASALVRDWLGSPSSIYGEIGAVALRIVLALAGVLLAFVVALSLAQPLSGPALERIASLRERDSLPEGSALRPAGKAVEAPPPGVGPRAPNGAAPARDVPFAASVFRSLRITTFALLVGLSTLGLLALVDAIVPPAAVVTVPLGFFVSALLVAWDMLDPSLGARELGVRARLAFFRRHFSAIAGFGLALAVVLLVPCAGLLVLPVGVAGASGLVARIERARRPQANAELEVVAP